MEEDGDPDLLDEAMFDMPATSINRLVFPWSSYTKEFILPMYNTTLLAGRYTMQDITRTLESLTQAKEYDGSQQCKPIIIMCVFVLIVFGG